MRNLKTQSDSVSFFSDNNAESVSERSINASEENSFSNISKMFSYPAVWEKAFTLGQNVRFTRTPEVEILRRRIEKDPIFAKQFEAFVQQESQKMADTIKCDQESIKPPLVEKELNAQSVDNKSSFYSSTILKQSEQQIIATRTEHASTQYVHAVQAESVEQGIKPFCYLSDTAFFECEPLMLEQIKVQDPQRGATSIDSANNETLSEAVSDMSITSLYRVLKCRFPQSHDSTVSEISAESVEDIEPIFDLSFTKNKASREVQIQSTEPIFRDDGDVKKIQKVENVQEIQELSMVDAPAHEVDDRIMEIAVNNNQNNIIDYMKGNVAKSASDLSSIKAGRKALQATNTPLCSRNTGFVSNVQFVDYGTYEFPPIDLLQEPVFQSDTVISEETLEYSAGILENVLEDFGIKGEIIHVRPGPVVTMYEFEPAAGVKSSRVIGLSDDIARSMSAISARVAVIPGRNVIGIELPNTVREVVYLRELIQSNSFRDSQFKLALALGKGINGEPVIAELVKMTHLLVAGTTGSGKSVAINTMILSILYRMTPEQCRLIMVDPKMLELSIYDGIPHLLTPVVTDPQKAVTALKWAVREMEERYRKMAKLGVRNIDGFNARVALAVEKGEIITCTVQSGFDKDTGEMLYHEETMDLTQLPYIVIIVDEMADLMMVAGKEIEGAIQRLAQMARAAGIHLIMATQRPSVDVITGTIKANFPTRISFQVTSKIDSRTILGEQGAETLLGQGDMLYMAGGGRIIRVHSPFVSDEEVETVVAHLKRQGKPEYLSTVTDSESDDGAEDAKSIAENGNLDEEGNELYDQAIKIVMRDKKCSTSYIQRRLSIGYNKAASLVERMEEEGIVGTANHVGKREILCNEWQ
ncbi:DNA translocase FtsK [Bartonella bacilliformis]|uniref:DNA translocase FtsK n=1 Tax=Bartonella bacilliformis TaxID=774 RepID=UPI00044B670A|nr:DNA translocase FtsK [Bartonella bacilliformis]EYS95763.1 DNA translocase ftsK [Bartonella bacilliformis Peru-18]KEG17929.1 DNA translocase ftsK [Bartonella bacilliformis CUSCO5]